MPKISVVIASVNGLPWIDPCLAALEEQRRAFDAEVIVVDCCRNGTAEHIRRNFPEVRLLHFSERLGIPELRAIGMSHASGDIIAIIKDHCIVSDNWLGEILREHKLGYLAVGGAIENGATSRITDWAVYFCEYSWTMLPLPHGEVDAITGANVSYKREALDLVTQSIKRDYWEYFLQEELRKAGVKFLSAPAIVAQHKKEFGYVYFLSQRFHYSRSFAAMRRTRISTARRLYYVLSTPLLPGLVMWRIGQQVFRKKRHYKEFLLALPLLLTFLVSYAVGEFVGYLFGPGRSLIKVE